MSEIFKGSADTARAEADAAATTFTDGVRRVRPTHYQRAGHSSGQVLQYWPSQIIDDPHAIRIMDELEIEYTEVDTKPKKARTARPAATSSAATTATPAPPTATAPAPPATAPASDAEGATGLRNGAD